LPVTVTGCGFFTDIAAEALAMYPLPGVGHWQDAVFEQEGLIVRIESIHIKNFRALQDVSITGISNMTVVVGKNGVGKSTFFDVFGFLRDCLEQNVRKALEMRGGFKEVVSRGKENESILFEIKFRAEKDEPLVTYILELSHSTGRPVVSREILQYRRGSRGAPWRMLEFANGRGTAVSGKVSSYEDVKKADRRREQALDSADILAIKGLGQFSDFEAIATFRKMVENWTVSDFRISEARTTEQKSVYSEHLSRTGDNLSQVAKFIYENHPEIWKDILQKMQERIPGVAGIEATTTEDNRLLLKFKDGAFKSPFLSVYTSDGTIKMLAYLVLLHDPQPNPLLCIEEPENQLYPEILEILAEEFREYSKRGQIFVSTHSPDFLNAVALSEVIVLEKADGYTTARMLKKDATLARLVEYGDKLGWLWKQGYFAKNEV
jgi:predicted ATPase